MSTPFTPRPGATANITVTASNVTVALPDCQQAIDLRVFNDDTQTVFITTGESTAAAAVATGIPIPAGVVEVLHLPPVNGPRFMAAIGTAANSRKIYFTPGSGI
jgi:hypothetical protein